MILNDEWAYFLPRACDLCRCRSKPPPEGKEPKHESLASYTEINTTKARGGWTAKTNQFGTVDCGATTKKGQILCSSNRTAKKEMI